MNRSLRNRILRLVVARQRAVEDNTITAVIEIPDNGRGPKSSEPFPRISRIGHAAIVTYKPGERPTDAHVAAMLGGVA